MCTDNMWIFTKEQLYKTPSFQFGVPPEKEWTYRHQAASFIQNLGEELKVKQLVINTATVYMHRFYMYHSFPQIQRYGLGSAAIFLSAKAEDQPRKMEDVIKAYFKCLRMNIPPINSPEFASQVEDMILNEGLLLQTLGFELHIKHPHPLIVMYSQKFHFSTHLAQAAYYIATKSLQATTMCLEYQPSIITSFCMYLASKWLNEEKFAVSDGKPWFHYIDSSVTEDFLNCLIKRYEKKFIKLKDLMLQKLASQSPQFNNLTLSDSVMGSPRNVLQSSFVLKRSGSVSSESSDYTSYFNQPTTDSTSKDFEVQEVKMTSNIPVAVVNQHKVSEHKLNTFSNKSKNLTERRLDNKRKPTDTTVKSKESLAVDLQAEAYSHKTRPKHRAEVINEKFRAMMMKASHNSYPNPTQVHSKQLTTLPIETITSKQNSEKFETVPILQNSFHSIPSSQQAVEDKQSFINQEEHFSSQKVEQQHGSSNYFADLMFHHQDQIDSNTSEGLYETEDGSCRYQKSVGLNQGPLPMEYKNQGDLSTLFHHNLESTSCHNSFQPLGAVENYRSNANVDAELLEFLTPNNAQKVFKQRDGSHQFINNSDKASYCYKSALEANEEHCQYQRNDVNAFNDINDNKQYHSNINCVTNTNGRHIQEAANNDYVKNIYTNQSLVTDNFKNNVPIQISSNFVYGEAPQILAESRKRQRSVDVIDLYSSDAPHSKKQMYNHHGIPMVEIQ